MDDELDGCAIEPIAWGKRQLSETTIEIDPHEEPMGVLSTRWVLFSREAIDRYCGERVEIEAMDEAFVKDLVGWGYYYSHPGGWFANAPCVRVSRTRVLITQRCGMDV